MRQRRWVAARPFWSAATRWRTLPTSRCCGRLLGHADPRPGTQAFMMVPLKVARTKTDAFNLDNNVDAAGCAAVAAEVTGHDA
jgi:hypothetical protein